MGYAGDIVLSQAAFALTELHQLGRLIESAAVRHGDQGLLSTSRTLEKGQQDPEAVCGSFLRKEQSSGTEEQTEEAVEEGY